MSIPRIIGIPSKIKTPSSISPILMWTSVKSAPAPGTLDPKNRRMKGIVSIDRRVAVEVNPTESATFPFARLVTRLARLPLGHAAIIIRPRAMLGLTSAK